MKASSKDARSLKPAERSRLARGVNKETEGRGEDQSGFYLVHDGLSAFVARAVMIEEATVSLDLKYYIYSDDASGRILTGMLLQAADRGVRVRLLVDDLGTRVTNPWVLAIDRHPNMEIRVFNPVEGRSGIRRGIEQVLDFGRINHRMHNKLLVCDGNVLITGGRNVADGYFSKAETEFLDVDMIAVGAVVPDASSIFDDYWNSEVAVPVTKLALVDDDTCTLDELRERVAVYLQGERESEFSRALEKSDLAEKLIAGDVPFQWGKGVLFADPPRKAIDRDSVPVSDYPGYKLEKTLKQCKQRLRITNAYLIPGVPGLDLFSTLQQNDVQVDILTNALATNDVAAVHGAYSRYRKPLLQAGVHLWELRPVAQQKQRLHWFKGKSRASLHAKTFVLDEDRGFVGSINLDSRSIIQNTEVGVLIENAEINRQLNRLFDEWTAPDTAWQLALDGDRIRWHWESEDGQKRVTECEPETRWWQRVLAKILSWLPIEEQI
ncbi:phospholipase D family protein [Microbulbifer celer]|uniref:Phospholipase D family protein n=1 Tax=Microbulbifer celer TaxID=435905 RepID=A0ABW3UEB2_9GAMM|nr:phospholipase D family protein [Microbulbifer celer]UFN55811.1 phospholipase D family protein [Microbulbifer celer]